MAVLVVSTRRAATPGVLECLSSLPGASGDFVRQAGGRSWMRRVAVHSRPDPHPSRWTYRFASSDRAEHRGRGRRVTNGNQSSPASVESACRFTRILAFGESRSRRPSSSHPHVDCRRDRSIVWRSIPTIFLTISSLTSSTPYRARNAATETRSPGIRFHRSRS